MLAIDSETHKIQDGLLAPPIVCLSFYHPGRAAWVQTPDQSFDYLRALLENPDEVLCGANIAYDFGCIAARWPELLPAIFAKYDRGEVHDVLIAATLDFIAKGLLRDGIIIDPRTQSHLRHPVSKKQVFRFSLETVTDLYCGRSDAKKNDFWRMRYALLEKTPLSEWPPEAIQYPKDDVINTYDVAQVQLERCKNLHNLSAQCRAAFAAHLGAMWGIRTDPKAVVDLGVALRFQYEADKAMYQGYGFFREDGSKDTKLIAERVTKAFNGAPPTTETGKVSISREALEDSGDDLLEGFAGVSKTKKLVETYLPFVESGTRAPINIKPNILLATGRASYEGLIQLLPRKGGVRECFVARPGTVFCSCDYAAIELSALAQVCLDLGIDSKLAKAINEGRDPHCIMGADLVNTDYDTFFKGRKGEFAEPRQAAKAANFGYPGMMGAVKFVQAKRREGLRVCQMMRGDGAECGAEKITIWKGRDYTPTCRDCVEGAEKLRQTYLSTWTEMPEYFNKVTALNDAQGGVKQHRSNRFRGDLTAPQAANTLFQGLAADGAKRALWLITEECYLDSSSPLFGSRVVIFAHDEFILEMPEERAHEAAMRQVELQIAGMREFIPDVKVSTEPALMRTWQKAAEPQYEKGKLVPWAGAR
jgi:hypothetical protein